MLQIFRVFSGLYPLISTTFSQAQSIVFHPVGISWVVLKTLGIPRILRDSAKSGERLNVPSLNEKAMGSEGLRRRSPLL